MNTSFKTILEIIDRLAAGINPEDRQQLEAWSGKSVEQVKNIISISHGKRQVAYKPFVDMNSPISAPLIFSKFDEDLKPDILFSCENTGYGQIIIASTDNGICYLVFFSGEESKVPGILQKEFPGSIIIKAKNEHQETALEYLKGNTAKPVRLHVRGTIDKLQIWETLSRVPAGKLISYGTLAKATGHMAQDIGIAMGDNRIALLIPCHRVIKSTGEPGQYHWGAKRKQAMIIKEAECPEK